MKKQATMYILCILIFAVLLSACGSAAPAAVSTTEEPTATAEPTEAEAEEPVAMIPNPIHEVDEDGLVQATGIRLPAPEGAEDVRWSYIELTGEAPIAQMNFVLDGAEAYLRAQPYAGFDAGDISGLYCDWPAPQEAEVKYCKAVVYCDGEAGYISWLDVAPGILYNLGMSKGASAEKLTELANLAFVPLQGDAGEDAFYAPYIDLVERVTRDIRENWENENPADVGVSEIFAYYADHGTFGWLQRDVNGDGIDELLLGEITQENWTSPIYNVFTLTEEGQLQWVLEGWE